jgi:hypothetical protein
MKEIPVPPASLELDRALARSTDWAMRIAEAWQSSVANIESDLPFSPRTAQMLMKIAEHPGITNAKHVSLLPPSWGTLHALTKLPSDEFERRIADGSIRPDLERKEIKAWKPVTKVQAVCPQTEDAVPLTLSDRVEVVTKQPQPTDRDRFAISDEEPARAGLESVTPTLPTEFAAAMALPEMIEDPVRESASVDIPLALRGWEKAQLEGKLASVRSASDRLRDLLAAEDAADGLVGRRAEQISCGEGAGRRDIEVFVEPECASKPNAKQAWVTATEPEHLPFVEALAKLPAEKQRNLADAAKMGEQVNAVTAFSACDPEASKTSDGIGKEAEPAPALDPQAWSMSTAKERQAFIKAVGRSEIEDAFHAIESGYGSTRGLNALNQSWNGATESDRREFYRRLFPANVWNRFQT